MARLIGLMVLTLILLAAILTGCSPPTMGFHIPTAPVVGKSLAEIGPDTAACEKAARQAATSGGGPIRPA